MMDFGRLGDDVGLGNDAGLGNEAGYIQDRFGLQYLGNRSLTLNKYERRDFEIDSRIHPDDYSPTFN